MPMTSETWEAYKGSGDHVMLEMNGEIEWYWDDESQGGRGKYFRTMDKGKRRTIATKATGKYAQRVLDNLL